MGDRANYAILHNGAVELFYSHWGGVTVAEDIFWGPKRTEVFIRKTTPETRWLNNVWAEGGVALDKDRRRLTYYGREWPNEKDVRSVYEDLLASYWKGWTIRRAEEWAEVAEAVGVLRESVTWKPVAPLPVQLDSLGRNFVHAYCRGLISFRRRRGCWFDCAIDTPLRDVLMNGADEVLAALPEIGGLEHLRAAFEQRREQDEALKLGDWLSEFCVIDSVRRSIRYSAWNETEWAFPFVREVWPSWTFGAAPNSTIQDHYAFTGREAPVDLIPTPPASPPNRTDDECIRLIIERIEGSEQTKDEAVKLMGGLVGTMSGVASGGVVLSVAPGALVRTPSTNPTSIDLIKVRLQQLRKRLKRRPR